MTAGVPLKNEMVEAALRKTHANFQLSAQMLKCSREAIYLRVQKSERLQAIVKEERDGVIDVAEGALQRAVLNGESWAIAFTLKTIGKSRGYVERVEQELTGKDGGPVILSNLSNEEVIKRAREILGK